MSGESEQGLRQRIAKLAAQNNRLKEVIESLASRSHHQSELWSQESPNLQIEVYEDFAQPNTPRLKRTRSGFGGLSAQTLTQANEWFPILRGHFRPLDPSPGWRCLAGGHVSIRLGFNLIGFDPPRIEEAVAQVEKRQLRDRDFIPVFITDQSDFGTFRFRGYVFEYVPRSISNAPKNRRAERRYYKERLDLIKAKWNLRDIVDLSK